MTHYLYVII